MIKCVLVIGASGDVGKGVAGQLLQRGYRVIGAGRDAGKLDNARHALAHLGVLETVTGSVEDEHCAAALRGRVQQITDRLDGVVVSVNLPLYRSALHELDSAKLLDLFRGNVISHFVAAKEFVPLLGAGGAYLAIGGGMADLVVPGFGALSMCQAAQRAMFRFFDAEVPARGARIHELMLYSVIAGESNRTTADPGWLTDDDVGSHVAFILENPDLFPDPIVSLKSRKQVGQVPRT